MHARLPLVRSATNFIGVEHKLAVSDPRRKQFNSMFLVWLLIVFVKSSQNLSLSREHCGVLLIVTWPGIEVHSCFDYCLDA